MGVLTAAVVAFDDLKILGKTLIGTGWKFQPAIFRLERKMPLIKRSMNYREVRQQLSWWRYRTRLRRILCQEGYGKVSFRPCVSVCVCLFIGWAYFCAGRDGSFWRDQRIVDMIESGAGIKEALDYVLDLWKDFVRYVAFVSRLCANCRSSCCSHNWESFMKADRRRRSSSWWRWLRWFRHTGKQEVSQFMDVLVSACVSWHAIAVPNGLCVRGMTVVRVRNRFSEGSRPWSFSF